MIAPLASESARLYVDWSQRALDNARPLKIKGIAHETFIHRRFAHPLEIHQGRRLQVGEKRLFPCALYDGVQWQGEALR